MVDGVTVADSEFHDWACEWMCLAEFSGTTIPNVEERIAAILELWHEPIPGGGEWKRGADVQLLTRERYRRGIRNKNHVPRGEHAIERAVLFRSPRESETVCLGAPLVDGVNALPLAKDTGGGRSGNVEADMLLLAGTKQTYRLFLVEVKHRSNNAWYAVVENLRQLRLFSFSEEAQCLFHTRCRELDLPESLPVTAVTLAPSAFYSSRGQKRESVAPAQELLRRMREEVNVEAQLATWDPTQRIIDVLSPGSATFI